MKLFRDVLRIKETKDLDSTNVSSFLSQYSKDPLVHTFINIISMLYLVVPYYEASAGEFLRCLSSLAAESSIGYPKGGCISIPSAYTKGIEKYGGKVKTRTTVNKIVVEDEKVRGVELDDGELITSNIVISNTGIKSTINDLVGRNNFSIDYLKLIDKLKYTVSALTLKIALKKPITEFKVITSFSLQNPEKKINSILKGKVPDDIDLFIPVPSNFDPGLVPNGRQLIIAGTPVPTANFEQNKETWINNVLKKLNIVFPKLKDNLLWWDISTPEDIEFLGGKEASVIGIAQNTDQSGSNRPSTSLPIEGLYIVGGDAGGWGIGTELAATSAIECAEKIVKNKSGK